MSWENFGSGMTADEKKEFASDMEVSRMITLQSWKDVTAELCYASQLFQKSQIEIIATYGNFLTPQHYSDFLRDIKLEIIRIKQSNCQRRQQLLRNFPPYLNIMLFSIEILEEDLQ